jgi:hypothetical protein
VSAWNAAIDASSREASAEELYEYLMNYPAHAES